MRPKVLQIKLTDEMREKFDQYAMGMGLPASTLGAFIIGKFVYEQDQIIQPSIKAMIESVGKVVAESEGFSFPNIPTDVRC